MGKKFNKMSADEQAYDRTLQTPAGCAAYASMRKAEQSERYPGSVAAFERDVQARVNRTGESWSSAALQVAKSQTSLYARARLSGLKQILGMGV